MRSISNHCPELPLGTQRWRDHGDPLAENSCAATAKPVHHTEYFSQKPHGKGGVYINEHYIQVIWHRDRDMYLEVGSCCTGTCKARGGYAGGNQSSIGAQHPEIGMGPNSR